MTGQAIKIMKIQIRFMKIPPKEARTTIQILFYRPTGLDGIRPPRTMVVTLRRDSKLTCPLWLSGPFHK